MRPFRRQILALLLTALLYTQFVACSVLPGSSTQISQDRLFAQLSSEAKPFILDVRTAREYKNGHIPGAINIDFRELEQRISEIQISKDSPLVIYCEHGIRADFAEMTLRSSGFESIIHLHGHMSKWRKNNLPIEKT